MTTIELEELAAELDALGYRIDLHKIRRGWECYIRPWIFDEQHYRAQGPTLEKAIAAAKRQVKREAQP